ncbi:Caspase-3 [Orchesella cincta]|uniref:Caspase-3 n=1 Tax=Orchesella cincta TaxID=48709 RepID=A0A1D2MYI8_ORCCI|nr:Caspase-3 [Orchesella cincta]
MGPKSSNNKNKKAAIKSKQKPKSAIKRVKQSNSKSVAGSSSSKTQKSNRRLKKQTPVKVPVKFDVLDSKEIKNKECGDYVKMLLKHKGKTIDALSWKHYATENFKMLKKGWSYEVEGQIKQQTKSSKFQQYITEQVQRNKNFSNLSLRNVTFESAEIYRYVGCGTCRTSLVSRKLCLTCKKRGLSADKKDLFMILRNIHIRDSTGSLKNVVCFDNECKKLVGKNACDFSSDEEAKLLLEKSFYGATLNLKISSARFSTGKTKTTWSEHICNDITRTSEPVTQSYYTEIYKPEVSEPDDFVIEDAPSVANITHLFASASIAINDIREEIDEVYNLNSTPSGHVFIINNRNFPVSEPRKGSEKDVENLESVFEALNFAIFKDEDLTVEQFQTRLKNFKKRLVAQNANACVLVVMSHGQLNEIEMTDGKLVDVWKDIISEFSDLNFPEFSDRAKIFIFEACQIYLTHGFMQSISSNFSPVHSDMMLCFAAIPGHYGYRSKTDGSFFITVLCNVLQKYAARVDLVEMLNMTQRLMKKSKFIARSGTKEVFKEQMCYHISLIFKKFRFKTTAVQM